MIKLFTFLAHTLNPLLLVLFILLPWTKFNVHQEFQKFGRRILYFVVSAIAMLVVCYLAEKGKALEVLAGYPGFPSGHTTLATAFCAAIAFLLPKRQRILFAVPAFVMGVSVVIIKWHALPDVFGGWALGGGLTWVSLLALGSSLKKAYCNGKN